MPRPTLRWQQLAHRRVPVKEGTSIALTLQAASRALSMGDRKEALRQLDRAWRIAPDHRGAVGPVYAQQLLADGNPAAALAALRVALTADPRPDTAELRARALAALGKPAEADPEFDVDGRAWEHKGVIAGWVRNGADPDASLQVEITDESATCVRLVTKPHESGQSRHAFEQRLKASKLKGSRFRVSVRLPGNRTIELASSPILLPAAARASLAKPPAPKRRAKLAAGSRRAVDVVIPVYRNFNETVACIESVLANPRPAGDLVIVDDCSPEPELSAWLARAAAKNKFALLRNEQNLGFPASVNRGLAQHPERDVIVLNSDTLVHGDWIARLRAAAHSAKNIGTVTPFTNDGSIVSYPRYRATDLTAEQVSELDRLAARVNHGMICELPVGVGFCQYFKREALDAAGSLDAEVFGSGYGEEVDLCMRQRSCGFRHVLSADTFVLHRGGSSFGKRKQALLDRNQRLIKLRHPRFPGLVKGFDAQDPARIFRRNLAAAPLLESNQRRVMLVTTALSGGAERFIGDREAALKREGLSLLVLRPTLSGDGAVITGADTKGNELHYVMPSELSELKVLLRALPLAHVEIHQFMGLRPDLVEAIRGLGAPYDVWPLDYVWVCPQITLIDKRGRYCGEPANVRVCERCIAQKKPNLPEKISVAALRKRSARWLGGARRVIAPAADVAERLMRYFPKVGIEVQAWQPPPIVPLRFNPPGRRIRVVLLGAIGQHKGYDVLLACARDAVKRDLPMEFSVLGFTQNDAPLLSTGRVFISGMYDEIELPALLRRENPHVIFLPSVWPETWSYTLSYALETGLPTVAFDLGAPAERMRSLRRGLLLPLNTSATELNDQLINIATSPPR